MKSILCCAVLILPAAHAAPRKPSGTPAAVVPPKARVVVLHPKRAKVLVSTSGASSAGNDKTAQAEMGTVPKVVAARPIPSKQWSWIPKFQKTGKDTTTWGFIMKRPF